MRTIAVMRTGDRVAVSAGSVDPKRWFTSYVYRCVAASNPRTYNSDWLRLPHLAPATQVVRSVPQEICGAQRIRDLQRDRSPLRHAHFHRVERDRKHGRLCPRTSAARPPGELAQLAEEAVLRAAGRVIDQLLHLRG
jgi:hypothetical protein